MPGGEATCAGGGAGTACGVTGAATGWAAAVPLGFASCATEEEEERIPPARHAMQHTANHNLFMHTSIVGFFRHPAVASVP